MKKNPFMSSGRLFTSCQRALFWPEPVRSGLNFKSDIPGSTSLQQAHQRQAGFDLFRCLHKVPVPALPRGTHKPLPVAVHPHWSQTALRSAPTFTEAVGTFAIKVAAGCRPPGQATAASRGLGGESDFKDQKAFVVITELCFLWSAYEKEL